MRLSEWPRMPFLNEELCGWIREHLETLGVEELAVYAIEDGTDDDGRRVLVATEIGLVDYRYGPSASTARFAIAGRIFPWQAVRGVDLRVETFRLWALEHRTRWTLGLARPRFRAGTEDPQLGRAVADFAKVAVIMAEPSGWPPEEPDVAAPIPVARRAEMRPDGSEERRSPAAPAAAGNGASDGLTEGRPSAVPARANPPLRSGVPAAPAETRPGPLKRLGSTDR